MTRLILLLALVAPRAFAMGDAPAKAVDALASCMTDYNFSCALAGACTQAQFCSACQAVSAKPVKACREKAYVYAAVEGLFGYVEGSCREVCSVGTTRDYFRARADVKSGDRVTVIQNTGASGGLGLMFKNGQAQIAEVSYSGPRHNPGTAVTLRDDAVSQPIQAALSCVKGSANAALMGCFTKLRSCGSGMKTAQRCALCTATTSCSGAREFFESASSLSCSGC